VTAGRADLDLIRRAAAGDGAAYETLLTPLEPGLRALFRSLLRSRPDASADDALQDLRIYLYQRLDRYNPGYPFETFARGLARNVAKRHLFKKSDLAIWEEDDEDASVDLTPLELESLPANLKDVMGVGRFEGPAGGPPPSREFLEVFELFLRYGGYPHQQVSFGYSILVWGKDKREPGKAGVEQAMKVPVTGDPDRVVQEVGPRRLEESSLDFLEDVRAEVRLEERYLDRVAAPLRARLAMTGAELFARDATSAGKFSLLTGTVIGRSALEVYFGKDPRASVAEWTRAVKERIKKVVQDPASRSRTVLPAAEPPP
jgi:RNA polymerase sigma factor (sigma-70 family)